MGFLILIFPLPVHPSSPVLFPLLTSPPVTHTQNGRPLIGVVLPLPVYVNMNELATLAAQKHHEFEKALQKKAKEQLVRGGSVEQPDSTNEQQGQRPRPQRSSSVPAQVKTFNCNNQKEFNFYQFITLCYTRVSTFLFYCMVQKASLYLNKR